MSSLAITLEEVYAAVGAEMGINRDSTNWDAVTLADVNRVVRAGRRRFYNPPPTDGPLGWKWSFLDQIQTVLTRVPTSDSTITIVDGTVTRAAGVWPAAAITENSFLVVDGTAYEVATRTSDTVIVLSNTSVDADALTTYELVQYRFPLASNFGGLNAPVTRIVGNGTRSPILEGWLDQDLRNLYAVQFRTGEPTRYATFAKTDAETGIPTWYVEFWPVPVIVYEMKVDYHINPGDGLENDIALAFTDPVHSETLLEAILSAAEQFKMGTQGVHSARYIECLTASISRDKRTSGVRALRSPRQNQRGYPIDLINAPLIYPVTP